MTQLFRDEAIVSQGDTSGRAIGILPVSWSLLTGLFAIIAIAVIAFLVNVNISRKESVSGILGLSGGEIRVMPAKPGIVIEVYVTDNQEVEIGQPLARVSTEQDLAGDSLDQQLSLALADQLTALQTKLDSLEEGLPMARRALVKKLNGELNQIRALKDSEESRENHLEVSRKAFELGKRSLAEGAITGDNQRQREYDYLMQQQALGDFSAQLAQLQGTTEQDKEALAKLASDQAQSRTEIIGQMAAIKERETNVVGTSGYLLKASSAGRVTAVLSKVGQPVDAVHPLLTIVPQGSELRAELFVPSRAIGFIKRGQKVRLMYEAFPVERFGSNDGAIEEIATTVLKPEELSGVVTLKEPVYRVLVRPTKSTVKAYGTEMELRTGMALTADLILEDRSFLHMMLDPLYAAGTRTFGN